jgi:hypothetical protein
VNFRAVKSAIGNLNIKEKKTNKRQRKPPSRAVRAKRGGVGGGTPDSGHGVANCAVYSAFGGLGRRGWGWERFQSPCCGFFTAISHFIISEKKSI